MLEVQEECTQVVCTRAVLPCPYTTPVHYPALPCLLYTLLYRHPVDLRAACVHCSGWSRARSGALPALKPGLPAGLRKQARVARKPRVVQRALPYPTKARYPAQRALPCPESLSRSTARLKTPLIPEQKEQE